MDKLLTVDEVAALLRVSTKTVRRMVKRGSLPTVDLGQKKLLFLEEAIRKKVLKGNR